MMDLMDLIFDGLEVVLGLRWVRMAGAVGAPDDRT